MDYKLPIIRGRHGKEAAVAGPAQEGRRRQRSGGFQQGGGGHGRYTSGRFFHAHNLERELGAQFSLDEMSDKEEDFFGGLYRTLPGF